MRITLSLLVFAFVVPFSAEASRLSRASEAPHDLIVRFRSAQDSLPRALVALPSRVTPQNAQILNAPEGVLQLRFSSPQEAAQAQAHLEFSPEVESVAPNFLYKTALLHRMRPAPSALATLTDALDALSEGKFPVPALPTPARSGADPLISYDWALRSIHMPEASQMDSLLEGAKPVTVAVMDTGVDYNHEDLVGAMWRHPDDAQEVGYDFAHQVNRPYDVRHFDLEGCMKDLACRLGAKEELFLSNPGHGTHCAGHVGAVVGNSLGMQGVGSNFARIMGLKFFYDAGEQNAGQGDDAAAIRSIDYAIQNGARVINASWGARMEHADAEKSELKAALIRAQKAGVIVVVAAGNDGIDQESETDPSYPAAYDLDNLIVVAAVDPYDRLADFSNYGAKTVHIAAPGVQIFSTMVDNHYSDVVARFVDPKGRPQQMDWDGTSMAAPLVAGAVTAVWAKNPTADYHQIRARILGTARPVAALQGKVSSAGVLDVEAALRTPVALLPGY